KAGDVDACLVRAELEIRLLNRDTWPSSKAKDADGRAEAKRVRKAVGIAITRAQIACKAGHGGACQWLVDNVEVIERHGYIDNADAVEKEAKKGFENACKKGDYEYCISLMENMDEADADGIKELRRLITPGCKRGNAGSCFLITVLDMFNLIGTMDGGGNRDQAEVMKGMQKVFARLLTYCASARNSDIGEFCNDIADSYLSGEENMEFGKVDPMDAVKMYQARCASGFLDSCNTLATLATGSFEGYPKKSPKLALEAQRKVCSLSPFNDSCDLCSAHKNGPKWSEQKAPICRTRLAWNERMECGQGKEERCEVLATMYQEHDGVEQSASKAVRYYRLACDSALKSSCSKLQDICSQDESLDDDENCKQSLIHTDVFYEAEWQFRQSGSAKVLQQGTGKNAAIAQISVSAAAGGGGGLSLKRGSLDTDLVISIVLDRARQAAIRLVVRELKKASKGRSVPIYLEDLLTQASLLLSDESSMRREKFQDLAMTVVRAFVASNLTQTVFATNEAILESTLWGRWAQEAKLKWEPAKFKKSDIKKLKGYMTNWVYYGLSSTKLFGRPGDLHVPHCPFRRDESKVVCALLSSGTDTLTGKALPNLDRLSAMLKIDAMLEGLSLAKALREQGSIDLRRLIEAIGHSETIADFRQTPGLNLEQWKTEIGNATENRLRDMRKQLKAAKAIFTRGGWQQVIVASDVRTMRERAEVLIGDGSPYLAIFDSENVKSARTILRIAKEIEANFEQLATANAKLTAKGGFSFGGGDDITAATAQAEVTLANIELMEVQQRLSSAFANWDDSAQLLLKIDDLQSNLDKLAIPMAQFRRSIVEIETILSRYKPPRKPGADVTVEVEASFEIAHVPLYALPELLDQLTGIASNLKDIDARLGPVFPGAARPKLKFAVSAVVRLLGFLDMMERVARTARLNQTCGDVMDALRLLGKVQNNEFTAPLFDVMDPVLHAIKTHEPMDVDLLFTIISEVRLDSLIASLADKAEKPCDGNDGGYECWTFKIIHSLQESVVRNGNSISLDGGAFAKRLASHGDDFRRKHKWRGYFHLTVGLGGLYSNLPDSMQTDGSKVARTVPLVGEQIGFGWASPTFWDDSLTFKTGVYGSGILYRAALDSSESNAIMVSPFIALDVFDLVELYAGPMALFYPPTDTQDASLEWGAAAGITVPLSSYLDKL
ncbi:MAG: SEL1-like repeat protein, partial [Kofleriaceae bacterium]|nr:SEL1-like repeat protein [Kofleriaceae bacterium]